MFRYRKGRLGISPHQYGFGWNDGKRPPRKKTELEEDGGGGCNSWRKVAVKLFIWISLWKGRWFFPICLCFIAIIMLFILRWFVFYILATPSILKSKFLRRIFILFSWEDNHIDTLPWTLQGRGTRSIKKHNLSKSSYSSRFNNT